MGWFVAVWFLSGISAYGIGKGLLRNFYASFTFLGYSFRDEWKCWLCGFFGILGLLYVLILACFEKHCSLCFLMPRELKSSRREFGVK